MNRTEALLVFCVVVSWLVTAIVFIINLPDPAEHEDPPEHWAEPSIEVADKVRVTLHNCMYCEQPIQKQGWRKRWVHVSVHNPLHPKVWATDPSQWPKAKAPSSPRSIP